MTQDTPNGLTSYIHRDLEHDIDNVLDLFGIARKHPGRLELFNI